MNYTTAQASLTRVFDRSKLFEPAERSEKRFWDKIKEATDIKPLGEGLYFRIVGSLGHGVGNPTEGGSYSVARTPVEIQCLVQGARIDSVVEVTPDFLAASQGDGSFSGDGEAEVIMNATLSLFSYADALMGACSNDGKLGTVNGAVTTSANVQLAWPDGAYKFRPHQHVDFYLSGTTTSDLLDQEILAIDYQNAILVMAATVNLSDGDEVYNQGVYGSTFPNGVKNIVSDGDFGSTLYTKSRAQYPFLNAYVDDGSGSAGGDDFTEQSLRILLDQIRYNQSKQPTVLRSNAGMAGAFGDTQVKDRVFVLNGAQTPGGVGGIDQESLAFVYAAQKLKWDVDRNLPARQVYALWWEGFRRHTLIKPDWFRSPDSGAIFDKVPGSGTLTYQYIGSQYMNMNITHRMPNANGLRTNYKDPNVPGDI